MRKTLVVALTGLAALLPAHASAQDQTPPAQAKVAEPVPQLQPWRERMSPRAFGAALGYMVACERGLELAAEGRPELAEAVKEARERRARHLGPGLAELRGILTAHGLDPDALSKEVLTPKLDEQLRGVVQKDAEGSVKSWSGFERVIAAIDAVSLLISLDPRHEKDPGLALRDGLVCPFGGGRSDAGGSLAVSAELPAGWAAGPKGKADNLVFRAVSMGGYGDETISVFIDSIPQKLTPEQEELFWTGTLNRASYEKSGATVLSLADARVLDRRAVAVSLTQLATRDKFVNRTVLRQTMFLHDRWTVTVQELVGLYAAPGAQAPTTEQGIARLDAQKPVLDHVMATLKLELKDPEPAAPATPAADPAAPKPSPAPAPSPNPSPSPSPK